VEVISSTKGGARKINLSQFHKKGLAGFQNENDEKKEERQPALSKEQRRQRVIESLDKLPPLSGLIYQIIHLNKKTSSKPEDYIPLFSDCQGIVERMLVLANTSFYGTENKITRIPDAIELLGHKTLRSLAYTALAKSAYENSADIYGFTSTGLWQHSFAVANVAKWLAEYFNLSQRMTEELFVAGLLHDIGKKVIGRHLGDYIPDYMKFMGSHTRQPCSVSDMEREIFDIDHEEAGRILMQHWKLSENIINAISYQPVGDDTDEKHYNSYCIIKLADFLALESGIGLVFNFQWEIKAPGDALKQLKIDADQFETIRRKVKFVLEEVALL